MRETYRQREREIVVWFLCLMVYQPSWVINGKTILMKEQQ